MAERLIRKIAFRFLWRRILDDGVLDGVDLVVEIFDRRERLVDRQLEEPDQEMVGPCRRRSRGIALDALAILVENRQRVGVIGDQVILAEEDVELLQVEHVGLGNDPGHLKDDVKIVAPVVHLGNVHFP